MGDAERDFVEKDIHDWALETWRILKTNYPLQAKSCFGEAPYNEGYFRAAFSAGLSRGVTRYIDRRISILEYIVANRP